MKFSFDKILAAFGNIRAMELTHADNHTEDRINLNSFNNEAFAISKLNVIFVETIELGGFYYLKTIIVGAFKIKTIKGATLMIIGNEFELKLKTDMNEFESEYSNISNRHIQELIFKLRKKMFQKLINQ